VRCALSAARAACAACAACAAADSEPDMQYAALYNSFITTQHHVLELLEHKVG
jgi:hypothetical protein